MTRCPWCKTFHESEHERTCDLCLNYLALNGFVQEVPHGNEHYRPRYFRDPPKRSKRVNRFRRQAVIGACS